MKTISNQQLTIQVAEHGAEMQSLRINASGRELLWQGLPEFWDRRAPILFPAVGGLWDGHYRLDGKSFAMPKHGFMRDKTWTVEDEAPSTLTFVYRDKGEDRTAFPWPYEVRVTYTLRERSIDVTFEVRNLADSTMYFQMGGHPGFILPDFDEDATVDGYLRLDGTPAYLLRATTQGCTEPEHFPLPATDSDGLIPLSCELFANEALILPDHQIEGVTIFDRQRKPLVSVRSACAVWLIWSPQGIHSPFVCAEPWHGLCDPIGFDGPVAERPFINQLAPGGTWTGGYSIDVLIQD